MSMFGHDLVPTPTSSSNPTATESGIGGIFTSILHTVTSTIENDLNNISNDIADKLSADLGIHQWYSLHLMDACEGSYTPNATHATGYNVSNCTTPTAGCKSQSCRVCRAISVNWQQITSTSPRHSMRSCRWDR